MNWRDLIDRPTWMEDAQCRGMRPALFVPERGEATAQIKAVCHRCDVQAECLAYAMNTDSKGIWGGTSGRERRALRERRHRLTVGVAS